MQYATCNTTRNMHHAISNKQYNMQHARYNMQYNMSMQRFPISTIAICNIITCIVLPSLIMLAYGILASSILHLILQKLNGACTANNLKLVQV